MAALDKIFAAIADFSKTMGGLHNDFLGLVRRDIERFKEKTDTLCGQMQWQGWSVLGISAFSASLAVVGSLIPKGENAASTALSNPRLGANDGINDAVSNTLKWIGDQLKNSEFLRTTCKSTSKFFNGGVSPFVQTWSQSKTTKLQSDIDLLKSICIQEGQQEKSVFSQETRRVQETALAIMQSKSKGG